MKATIEVPDELYRQVVAKTAVQGRALHEVTVELYQRWVAEDLGGTDAKGSLEWLDAWVAMGAEACKDLPAGPTGRELIQQDRQRLEAR
jgi:hypothetical protein